MGENFKLCLGCMEPKTADGVCPNCGYSDDAPYLPSYIAPGTVLNERYLVGRLLKYNGEGATYIAYDTVTDRKVLIREYMPDTLCSRVKGSAIISVNPKHLVQYKAFMSEFTELNQVLSRMRTLNHINPALELFAENNTTYVVFAYIKGMTLKDYLQENAGELSWEEVKKIFPPIFTTLSLVHNAGLVHRGISPETIWVTDKGELKITDFCIAAARTANTELASEVFAGYAAPEQYSSSSWHGTWTDVYGISALLYRILTGSMPTEAMSRIGNDNLCEPAKLNPNIPPNVSKVIMAGLKLSGEVRIQTITEFVTKLFEQPEYLERKTEKTISMQIPKQPARSISSKNMANNLQSRKKNAKVKQVKVGLMVFLIVFVILAAAGTASLVFLNGSGSSSLAEDAVSDTSAGMMLSSAETSSSETSATVSSKETQTSSEDDKKYEMPSFVNKNYEAIKNSETYKGWLKFVPEYEYNDSYEKNVIFYQSIEAGELIAEGTEVVLKISLGPQNVSVPDYYGLTEKEYTKILNDNNIKFSVIYQANNDYVNGYVFKTSKEPGEIINVAKGEELVVYVAKNDDYSSISSY